MFDLVLTVVATGGSDVWTIITAGATVAAAALVLVQVGRELRHEHVRRRTVNTRIEAIAYHLRRQLQSWVGEPNSESTAAGSFEQWIRDSQHEKMLGQHLDRAERRLEDLMALRPDAWPTRGRALDRCFVAFLAGTRRLNEYAATPRPSSSMKLYTVESTIDQR